jgi:hypothetical protein
VFRSFYVRANWSVNEDLRVNCHVWGSKEEEFFPTTTGRRFEDEDKILSHVHSVPEHFIKITFKCVYSSVLYIIFLHNICINLFKWCLLLSLNS